MDTVADEDSRLFKTVYEHGVDGTHAPVTY